jgi:hypothetical protein
MKYELYAAWTRPESFLDQQGALPGQPHGIEAARRPAFMKHCRDSLRSEVPLPGTLGTPRTLLNEVGLAASTLGALVAPVHPCTAIA